jgi:hypothetical protein
MQNYAPMCVAALMGVSVLFYIPSAPESYDPGGNVMEHYRMVQAANRSKLHAVISGTCISACTMRLGINNVCIDPNATLLFHQASHHGTIIKSEYDTKILMSMYPKMIQEWVRRNGALNSHELTKLTGREAIKMGIPSCWQ